MKRVFTGIFLIFLIAGNIRGEEISVGAAKDTYDSITTRDGITYQKCEVTRVEQDALVVRHNAGVVRISLFDLGQDFQDKYNFDPVSALQKYKADQEALRKMEKERFLEKEKYLAEQERIAAMDQLYSVAKTEWVPSEGHVIWVNREGVFVSAKKVVMVPTKKKSALGFTVDGPPKRKLQRFNPDVNVIFLKGINARRGQDWKGFIEPFSSGTAHFDFADYDMIVPSHAAMTLRTD